ncbi:MAG: helix-turn-helix domain-containing protein [Lewinellaceae bacterium]|nr:helix-turn-helix domain-containing protein [Lewinellaceae bacterium]
MTSLEQRQQIRELVHQGLKAPQIAQRVKVSVYTVRKWRQRLKKGVPYLQPWGVRRQGQ